MTREFKPLTVNTPEEIEAERLYYQAIEDAMNESRKKKMWGQIDAENERMNSETIRKTEMRKIIEDFEEIIIDTMTSEKHVNVKKTELFYTDPYTAKSHMSESGLEYLKIQLENYCEENNLSKDLLDGLWCNFEITKEVMEPVVIDETGNSLTSRYRSVDFMKNIREFFSCAKMGL